MFEKVSQHHPDKVADRIGGALVDLAYTRAEGGWAKSNPRIAGELTLGHGTALVILETDADITPDDVRQTVQRISGITPDRCHVSIVPQDPHLADNQRDRLRCGDNGLFKGSPLTPEQRELTALIKTLDEQFHSDAKAVIGGFNYRAYRDGKAVIRPSDETTRSLLVTICQSNATEEEVADCWNEFWKGQGATPVKRDPNRPGTDLCWRLGKRAFSVRINPLGDWTGGLDTDTGALNRKLGSDLGDGITGGGTNGKDLSKGDVSINIVCFLKAQASQQEVTATCSIGDETITFRYADGHTDTETFADIVEQARLYILTQHGSFEKFSEYGLIS